MKCECECETVLHEVHRGRTAMNPPCGAASDTTDIVLYVPYADRRTFDALRAIGLAEEAERLRRTAHVRFGCFDRLCDGYYILWPHMRCADRPSATWDWDDPVMYSCERSETTPAFQLYRDNGTLWYVDELTTEVQLRPYVPSRADVFAIGEKIRLGGLVALGMIRRLRRRDRRRARPGTRDRA